MDEDEDAAKAKGRGLLTEGGNRRRTAAAGKVRRNVMGSSKMLGQIVEWIVCFTLGGGAFLLGDYFAGAIGGIALGVIVSVGLEWMTKTIREEAIVAGVHEGMKAGIKLAEEQKEQSDSTVA
jgi:hypothetical protein